MVPFLPTKLSEIRALFRQMEEPHQQAQHRTLNLKSEAHRKIVGLGSVSWTLGKLTSQSFKQP